MSERSSLKLSSENSSVQQPGSPGAPGPWHRRICATAEGSPALAAGHSLGEYSAHVAAGTLTFADAVRTVRSRGRYMQQAVPAGEGAMAAILGLPANLIAEICSQVSDQLTPLPTAPEAKTFSPNSAVVSPANLNSPDQTVISGDPEAVERAGELCKSAGAKRVLPLNVSGAFHSPLMQPAVAGLREALDVAPFGEPTFAVVANATAEFCRSRDTAVELLAEQLTAPVRWVASMQRLAGAYPDARWLELGPGSVLSGLLKRIVPGASCTPLGNVAEIERWLAQ